jgi:VWFA-related protein
VVRTELVQLDVTVADKDGRNVAGLTARDFVLLEDGRPQALSHFATGGRPGVDTSEPESVAAPAPAAPAATPVTPPPLPPAAPRGRHVVLLVDDLHTAAANLPQAQEAMRRFVREQIAAEDRVAIVSTSGSGGVFQDFTSDPEALVRAIARLRSRYEPVEALGRPYLTEHQAELIDRGDVEALRVATEELLQIDDYLGEDLAKTQAYNQARRMVVEMTQRSGRALAVIESVVRGLAPLTGRKVVVLASDGFLIGLGSLETSAYDVRKITDAATRAGVVLYSLDTRGLLAEPPGGAASFQGPGVLRAPGARVSLQARSVEALRQGLNALAADTGGFLVKNSNDLDQGLGRILRDNETYYLLAYEPTNTARDGRFRKIQVRLRGRPELKVRTRSGYFAPDDRKASGPDPVSDPEARREREIAQALGSLFPLTDVPLRLAADFIALPPQGPQAVLKIHADLRNVPFERQDERYRADLEFAGAVYDEAGNLVGEVAGERAALNLTAESYVRTVADGVTLQKSVPLAPGLYQVRLAAREASRSLLGSVSRWVEIPDVEAQPLTLSSVFLLADIPVPLEPSSESREQATSVPERAVADVQIDKTFGPGQGMHYALHVYTSATAAAEPVTLQAQIWQGKRLIGVTPKHELAAAPEGRRWSERIALEGFPPGDYELRVVANGSSAEQKAERRVSFRVES